MFKNEKCCCEKYLEKGDKFNISFDNEVFKIYGNLNKGQKIILKYNGKLIDKENKEKQIFLNYGYGNLWMNKGISKMDLCDHSDDMCYCTVIQLANVENLFFCFMDNQNNWDLKENSSYVVRIDNSLTTLTKKNISVAIAEEEYISYADKLFKLLTNKFIYLFESIGNLFNKVIKIN